MLWDTSRSRTWGAAGMGAGSRFVSARGAKEIYENGKTRATGQDVDTWGYPTSATIQSHVTHSVSLSPFIHSPRGVSSSALSARSPRLQAAWQAMHTTPTAHVLSTAPRPVGGAGGAMTRGPRRPSPSSCSSCLDSGGAPYPSSSSSSPSPAWEAAAAAAVAGPNPSGGALARPDGMHGGGQCVESRICPNKQPDWRAPHYLPSML
jgi:hypothetical protein